MGSCENCFPWSQYDLLCQNDLANNWVSVTAPEVWFEHLLLCEETNYGQGNGGVFISQLGSQAHVLAVASHGLGCGG